MNSLSHENENYCCKGKDLAACINKLLVLHVFCVAFVPGNHTLGPQNAKIEADPVVLLYINLYIRSLSCIFSTRTLKGGRQVEVVYWYQYRYRYIL
jgi:hypothetical protein